MKRKLMALGALFLLSVAPPIAHAADDLASLTQEATKLEGDKQKILDKLQPNLQAKRANEEKLEKLDKEGANIQAQGARLEARRAGVTSLCNRTVPEPQLPAAQAQCDAVLIPFNRDIDALNKRSKENSEQIAKVESDEKVRAAEAKEIIARAEEIERRITAARSKISLLLKDSALQCMKNCGGGSSRPEVGAYCLQKCWDRTASGLPEVEKTEQYKAQFGSRTFEQAIDEYRKSGPAYIGPKMGPIKEPPPPK